MTQLTDYLPALIDVAEALLQEISWANRNDRLISLAIPSSTKSTPPPGETEPPANVEELHERIDRLEQMIATLAVIVTGDGSYEDVGDAFDSLAVWATNRFDADALVESLGVVQEPILSSPRERQRALFPDEPQEE